MKHLAFIFILIICASCKNTTHTKVKSIKTTDNVLKQFVEDFESNFLGSVGFLELTKPYLISSRIFNEANKLPPNYIKNLKLHDIFKDNDTLTKYGMTLQIGFYDSIKSFVVYQYKEKEKVNYKLVNYTSNYQFIDALDVSYFDLTKQMNHTETYVFDDKLFLYNKEAKCAEAFNLLEDGRFVKKKSPVKFNYLALKKHSNAQDYLSAFDTRVVKAKNGLIIRDSLGNKIGKLDYLQAVNVLSYSPDKTTINDNGTRITGFKAKIVINPDLLKAEQNYYVDPSNIGYVFDGFLFKLYQYEEGDYRYDSLSINKKYIQSIDLRELLEVKQIKLDKYLNRTLKKPKIVNVTDAFKTEKLVTLTARNGKKIFYKDTTYNSEYSPTKTYNVIEDSNFEDTFIVQSHMVFDYQRFEFISKANGSLLDSYAGGYPNASPDKTYVVSVDYDVECPSQRTLFIDKIIENKIIRTVEIYYNLEGHNDYIKFEKTTDPNEIYWLSNSEFIIKFWGATECYSDSENYFYYKYKINNQLLQLLEAK